MINIQQLLPKYYRKSRYVNGLLNPINAEFEKFYADMNIFLKNMSIDDADIDGIRDFENDFFIPLSDDEIELRRSRVKARYLHPATTTFDNLKNIVTSFDNNATVTERPSEYTVVIAGFETSLLQDIAESVNEIKPAHIAITYNSHDVEVGKIQEYVSTHVVADSTIETVECVKYPHTTY